MRNLLADNYTNHLASFVAGEEEGFDHYFKLYYKSVCFFAGRYVEDKDAAEDIVVESFIRVWNKRDRIESEAGLRGYLYKTVYNGCLREVRSRKSEVRKKEGLIVISDQLEKDCLENMIRAETLRRVHEAMEKLPSECRKVFMKLFVEGKSVVEAAAELKVAVSTVKNQKARGIRLLRMKLTSFLFIVFSLWVLV